MSQLNTDLIRHYAFTDVEVAVTTALDKLDAAELTLRDLAALDQFHTGGIDATRALAQKAGLKAGDHVLDVGGGLGGSARLLAQEFGCDVTVLELMASYVHVGEMLTERTHLTNHVHFQHGNALDMPFAEQSFDVVWTQHSSMNISDKPTLYAQIYRVLRSGGILVMHEVVAGEAQPVQFPVMWAREASNSCLIALDDLKALLIQTGFEVQRWDETTAESITWFEKRVAALQNPQPNPNANGLGLHLLLGSEVGLMLRNFLLNLQQGRVRIIQTVLHRP